MIKKLRDTAAVFHSWAHQEFPSAECGKVSYSGNQLYSYAACIAAIIAPNVVAHSTRSWSNTTSNHQSSARAATNHMNRVFCYRPDWTPAQNRTYTEDRIRQGLSNLPEKVFKKDGTETILSARKRTEAYSTLLYMARQFNEYLYMSRVKDVKPLPISEDMEGAAEALRKDEARKKRAEAKAKRDAAKKAEQYIQAWRNHEDPSQFGNTRFNTLAPALRLSKDGMEVETSWGASIPVASAIKLWEGPIRIARRHKLTIQPDHDLPRAEIHLGPYRLNEVRPDGSIKVGCHDISFSEIESIAIQLELIKEKVA